MTQMKKVSLIKRITNQSYNLQVMAVNSLREFLESERDLDEQRRLDFERQQKEKDRILKRIMDSNLRMAGTGGSELPDLKAEFSGIPHDKGTIGAARSQNVDSANSQFFINFQDNHFLNRQYTVYGRVIEGMEFVAAITRGEPPANPDRMISLKVAADV